MSRTKINYSRYLSFGCVTVVITSIGWVYYQVRSTKDILNNAVDLSILNFVRNERKNINKTRSNEESAYVDLDNMRSKKSSNPWSYLKFMFAQRLIGLCQNESDFVRVKALMSLGKIKNLSPGHFSILSNMIDEHTAVSLARVKNVDRRLFKEPPVKYLKYDNQMIMNEMKELFIRLYEKSNHSCLEYLISKTFFDAEDSSRVVDSDTAPVETAKLGQNGQDLLPVCLESLLHHASIESFGQDIVKSNALPLLSEIHNRLKDNINVNVALCRIMSYLSFHTEILEELHATGWIGILSDWMKHDDVRISIPATRALANLENKLSYRRHVYLLHPSFITNDNQKVDVVFVHGLLGGVFFTWRQRTKVETVGLLGKPPSPLSKRKESITQTLHMPGIRRKKPVKLKSSEPHTMQYIQDFEEDDLNEVKDFEVTMDDIPIAGDCTANCGYSLSGEEFASIEENGNFTFCWPRDWLAEDCDDLRVIGVNYDTALSKWNSFCPHISGKTNIEEQSLKLMANLLKAGVGHRPIIWVTHSMGGILVKNILCKAFYSSDPRIHELVKMTKGIVFYSTPHFGSNLATFNAASQLMLRLSIEVQDLRENSPFLLNIHDRFLKIIESHPIKVVTFVETKKTVFTALKFNFQLVTPKSGNTGIGEYYEIPLDHLGICKPISRFSFLYRKVLDFVQEIADSTN